MKKIILDDVTINKILEKYQKGQNVYSIQQELGVGRRHVERTILAANLSLKTKTELISDAIPELKNRDLLHSWHHDDNLSLLDIATRLRTNEQVIKTAFKRLRLKKKDSAESKNDKFFHKFPTLQDKDALSRLYLIEKKSPETIATQLGCSDGAVQRALKRFGFQLRNHSHSSSLSRANAQQRLNAKIARNLRTRFWIALSGKTKMTSAVSDLGCSIDEFKEKIALAFHDNPVDGRPMSWDNYGEWEMDHITPLSQIDLTAAENQKKACHYSNLQPLWRSTNRKKSNKLPSILPNRVPFFIVAGAAGSGKSWVCDQLQSVNYISYDSIPKEQHYHYMIELSKNGLPIVYDPFRKISTIYNRYKDLFDMKVVLIIESPEIVYDRLQGRGSKLTLEKVVSACKKIARYRRYAHFMGTSAQVLEYLRQV